MSWGLMVPMCLEEKKSYFQFLVKLGFKEIEIGFPAASQIEYDFLRQLVERRLIPDDVRVQVLVQCREHLIKRTFEAIQGIKKVVVHIYNSTSTLQRDVVFHKNMEEIKQIARRKRQMEERQRREEEQRVREERARIREEKKLVRSSLGSAMDQQISTNEEAVSSSFVSEYESPEIAAKKAKEAQQQREQERRERERAERLKAERESFENKNINEIFKEYSKNPYYMAKRGITYVLAHAFGIIPVVTDNPDYIRMFKVKKEKEQAEAEAKDLTEKLKGIVADMEETQKKLTEKEEEIEQVENELVQAQIDANDQYERMKVRIKYMYESGNTQFVAVLAESKNMGDFLNKAEYISQISEYDRDELIRYQDTVEEIEVKEEEVQAEYEELNTLQTKLVGQQTEVQKMIDENKEKLSNIQSEIDANAAALEKAKEVERIQQEQAGNNYIPSTGGNVVSGNGYFTHPCPGMSYQSSYFGEIRPYEVGGHKGHDYAAAVGTPTYAAAAGTVVIAGFSYSAGNWVVINHGNGLVTKYMHHSALAVRAGQYVEKGQQIGYVGSTGQSTGPHLHFQVELNNVPVNPDLYM